MKMRAALVLLTALASAGGASAPRPAEATVLFAATLDELSREAGLVAVVTPTAERRSYWRDGRVVTDVVCAVTAAIKGPAAPTALVRLPGGVVGAVGQSVSGAPELPAGVPVVVFLSPLREGARTVLSMAAGVLPMAAPGGVVSVLPARTEGITFLPGRPSPPATVVVPAQGLPLATFVARVRAVAP